MRGVVVFVHHRGKALRSLWGVVGMICGGGSVHRRGLVLRSLRGAYVLYAEGGLCIVCVLYTADAGGE